MTTVVIVLVAGLLLVGFVFAILHQNRRTSGRTGDVDAQATSANQRRDDRGGWSA